MPNVATILKQEISRISKKEAKSFFNAIPGLLKSMKRTVSAQGKKITALEATIRKMEQKTGSNEGLALPKPEKLEKARLGSGNIAKLRKKLDLTRAEMGKIIGASTNSIFLWENDKATPRATAKAKIIALRGLGKKEINKLLAAVGKKEETPASAEAKPAAPKKRKAKKSTQKAKATPDKVAATTISEATKPQKPQKRTPAKPKSEKPVRKAKKALKSNVGKAKAKPADAEVSNVEPKIEVPVVESNEQVK